MPTPIVASQDGPRLTVAQLVKAPTVIPKRILSNINQEFLADTVLRKLDDAPSGVVVYSESTPLFTADNPLIIDEFGEIPVTNGQMGIPRVVKTVERAMGLRVSKRMINRNTRDAIDIAITQIRNTMVRSWEDAFLSALIGNASIQTMATDTPWSATNSHIRKDVNTAKFLIRNASADGNGQNGSNKFGYKADSLILSTVTETDFLDSNEVTLPYVGNIADRNIAYTGLLPNKFLDLDVMSSWRLDVYSFGSALVLQRKVVGGISDEVPLQATPMYGEGNGPNGGPTQSWRTDVVRQSAIVIDQPLACVLITGVHS